MINTGLSSATNVCWQRGTARIQLPLLLTAGRATIDQYLLPAGPTTANLQHWVCCCGPMLGHTDGHSTVTWTQLRTLCMQCQLESTVKCREFLYRCISSSIYTVGYVPLYLRVGGCVYIHGLFHQWRVHVCNQWANAMDKYIVVNLSLVTGGCKRIKMQEYNGSVIYNKIQ